MRARLALAFVVSTASLVAGCRNLTEVPANVCGNRVVEEGETCDGDPASSCLPPGAAGQCHFDCGLRTDGKRPECPTHSGCDTAGVCRETTGGYFAPRSTITDNATSLLAADFDGDGRAEVLSEESLSVLGARKFRLHFFDREGVLASSWSSPRPVISLAVADVSGDSRNDIVFADQRIAVLLGQPDRTLISEAYPSYFLPNIKIRVSGTLRRGPIGDSTPFLVATEDDGQLHLRHSDSATKTLLPVAALTGTRLDDLAGELALGDLFPGDATDPCVDTAVAFVGATEAHVYSVCTGRAPGDIAWRKNALDNVVPLVPPEPITSGPLIGDVDGDGHLDLVIGTEGQAYVAFGDGLQLTAAQPWLARVEGAEEPTPIAMPLALGDFSGDGPVDLVYPGGFFVSRRDLDGTLQYRALSRGFGELWTSARVADLNANGKLDVVAVSESKLDIDFYNGTGTEALNPAVIPTQRPVRALAVGDYDGDLIDDLAYLQNAPPSEPTEIMVAFGNVAGPPQPGVTAARASGVVQIGAVDYDLDDQAAELFLASVQSDAQGVEGASFAWLTGSERRMLCLVELATFDSDKRIDSMAALSVGLGAFTKAGQHDALVLGTSDFKTVDAIGMWLMPDLRNRTSQPQLLDWDLDPDVKPLRGANLSATQIPELDMLTAAGDLDGDGVDELVLAAPNADRTRCHVLLAQLRAAGAGYALANREVLSLDTPCVRGDQLALEDLDADSARDIVLLTNVPGASHVFRVFWNDGAGQFAATETTKLTSGDDDAQAFAVYPPSPGEDLRLAYVTSDRLRVLQLSKRRRGVEMAPGVTSEIELERGTGVAAGDVDGDGIADLIVADAGNIRLFRAQLKP